MASVKIQIKSVLGTLLFEFEKENNTVKDTLVEAVICGAYLRDANLQGADLRDAYLQGAYLQDAYLQGAYLQGAYLQGAYLQGADLRDANLQGANLQGADLQGAYLQGAKNVDYAIAQTRILPDGDIIGWKKCYNGVIVKLLIPSDAKRSHAFGRKCRAEYAKVIEVIGSAVAISGHDKKTEYRVGETVKCDKWDDNWMEECSGGIHFFITKIEAENY